mgnify:CR=1 FL=1
MKKKRIVSSLLVATLLGIIISGCSDKVYVNRAITWADSGEDLDTALKSVEKATELEETKDWPKTYYAKGYVYQKIYENEKTDIAEDPLFKAFDNYEKAYNMEGGESLKGSIDATLFQLRKYFINDGVKAFQESDYRSALNNFSYALKVTEMPVFKGQVDTAVIFNAGIAAQNLKEWDKAADYYKQAAEYGYDGARSYILLNNAYLQAGDTTKAVKALKEGFEKYPGNKQMIGRLINYFLLEAKEPQKAIEYLDAAEKEDPDNAEYYRAEATAYDNMGENEKAIKNYKKALELDPDMFMALYNMGVLYYNQAVDIEGEANTTKDEAKYKELKEKARAKLKEALPYLEKALEVQPENASLVSTLSTVYYRLRVEDEKYMEKYEKMQEKLQQLNDAKNKK